MVLGSIGGVSAWVSGTTRLPFVVGVDRYLPAALARLHPQHGTPHVSLIVHKGVLCSLVLLAALSGSTIKEAFVILLDMTIITSMLPLLYIFAAYPILRRRAARTNRGSR